jgi:hypothetical protein
MAAASPRPRVRSLRYVSVARGVIYGVTATGRPQVPAGISALDEDRLLAAFGSLGIKIATYWDSQSYARCRDAEVAAWIAYRLASASHPAEGAMIASRLAALSLRHLISPG